LAAATIEMPSDFLQQKLVRVADCEFADHVKDDRFP
jgi:hypothetical protein